MHPRHAAALALAVWYLMVPPPILHGNPPVDLEAPLSRCTRAQPNVRKAWSFYKLAKAELAATLPTKGIDYNSTSLRALNLSPATTRV